MKYKLINEIIKLSVANDWITAKSEWYVYYTYIDNNLDSCLCGKTPIKEICILKNNMNFNTAKVGNCCVRKFMELNEHACVLRDVKQLQKNIENLCSLKTINILHDYGTITNWEQDFYTNIRLYKKYKKPLSPSQKRVKIEINNKIISKQIKNNINN